MTNEENDTGHSVKGKPLLWFVTYSISISLHHQWFPGNRTYYLDSSFFFKKLKNNDPEHHKYIPISIEYHLPHFRSYDDTSQHKNQRHWDKSLPKRGERNRRKKSYDDLEPHRESIKW